MKSLSLAYSKEAQKDKIHRKLDELLQQLRRADSSTIANVLIKNVKRPATSDDVFEYDLLQTYLKARNNRHQQQTRPKGQSKL